jgi:hypothetical protein
MNARSAVKALERHHLFPRAFLGKKGVSDLKLINHMANYTLLEWPENIDISDSPPSEYVPAIRTRFSAADWAKMEEAHALPAGWEKLEYAEFLDKRRQLMASIIQQGFNTLR